MTAKSLIFYGIGSRNYSSPGMVEIELETGKVTVILGCFRGSPGKAYGQIRSKYGMFSPYKAMVKAAVRELKQYRRKWKRWNKSQ